MVTQFHQLHCLTMKHEIAVFWIINLMAKKYYNHYIMHDKVMINILLHSSFLC